MADHHPDHEKALAVGRVRAGETQRAVARELGVSSSTLARWVAKAGSDTEQGKKIDTDAEALRREIEAKQEVVRQKLLDRIEELIPKSDDIRAVTTAYGIVTDKAQLTAGKPTGIHEHRSKDPLDVELEQLLAEEAAKRAAAANGSGH